MRPSSAAMLVTTFGLGMALGDSNSPVAPVAPVAPAHAGFDPGTTQRLAAGAFPSSPNYWDSCPDSPTGRCHGTLRAGSGFYTLGGGSTNASCRINGMNASRWTPNAANPGVPCPYKFSWHDTDTAPRGGGGVIARAEVDSRGFVSGETPNLYVGLQENIVVPPVYGGIALGNSTMCPLIADVDRIAFKMRSKRCYGAGVPKPSGFGRVAAYFKLWNVALHRGVSVSVDVFTFLDGRPWSPTLPIRRPVPFLDGGGAWHIDGAAWGFVPNGSAPLLDTTPDCSTNMAAAPWLEV